MNRNVIVGLAVVAALLAPALVLAHGGHAHKVMGTVSSIDGNHVVVKATDGKTVMVMLDAKTKIIRGKATMAVTAIKVGDRIVAEGAEEKQMIVATIVQLGAAPVVKK